MNHNFLIHYTCIYVTNKFKGIIDLATSKGSFLKRLLALFMLQNDLSVPFIYDIFVLTTVTRIW